jgi:hypothetical protein
MPSASGAGWQFLSVVALCLWCVRFSLRFCALFVCSFLTQSSVRCCLTHARRYLFVVFISPLFLVIVLVMIRFLCVSTDPLTPASYTNFQAMCYVNRPPAVPSQIQPTDVFSVIESPYKFRIAWNAPDSNRQPILAYYLYYAPIFSAVSFAAIPNFVYTVINGTAEVFCPSNLWVFNYTGQLTSTSVQFLTPGKSYAVTILSSNSVGLSLPSPQFTVSMPGLPPPTPYFVSQAMGPAPSFVVTINWNYNLTAVPANSPSVVFNVYYTYDVVVPDPVANPPLDLKDSNRSWVQAISQTLDTTVSFPISGYIGNLARVYIQVFSLYQVSGSIESDGSDIVNITAGVLSPPAPSPPTFAPRPYGGTFNWVLPFSVLAAVPDYVVFNFFKRFDTFTTYVRSRVTPHYVTANRTISVPSTVQVQVVVPFPNCTLPVDNSTIFVPPDGVAYFNGSCWYNVSIDKTVFTPTLFFYQLNDFNVTEYYNQTVLTQVDYVVNTSLSFTVPVTLTSVIWTPPDMQTKQDWYVTLLAHNRAGDGVMSSYLFVPYAPPVLLPTNLLVMSVSGITDVMVTVTLPVSVLNQGGGTVTLYRVTFTNVLTGAKIDLYDPSSVMYFTVPRLPDATDYSAVWYARNEAGWSLAAPAVPVRVLAGSPQFVSVVASDPIVPNINSIFAFGKIITITFDRNTTQPLIGLNVPFWFTFSSTFRAIWSAEWVAPNILVLRVESITGTQFPVIGVCTLTLINDLYAAVNTAAMSSRGYVSPPLMGNWGVVNFAVALLPGVTQLSLVQDGGVVYDGVVFVNVGSTGANMSQAAFFFNSSFVQVNGTQLLYFFRFSCSNGKFSPGAASVVTSPLMWNTTNMTRWFNSVYFSPNKLFYGADNILLQFFSTLQVEPVSFINLPVTVQRINHVPALSIPVGLTVAVGNGGSTVPLGITVADDDVLISQTTWQTTLMSSKSGAVLPSMIPMSVSLEVSSGYLNLAYRAAFPAGVIVSGSRLTSTSNAPVPTYASATSMFSRLRLTGVLTSLNQALGNLVYGNDVMKQSGLTDVVRAIVWDNGNGGLPQYQSAASLTVMVRYRVNHSF